MGAGRIFVMNKARSKRLQTADWRIGDSREFLGLTEEEGALIELRLGFAALLRKERLRQDPSRAALAKRVGSSQSRIAKMEAGEPSVSLDLMFRAALSLGVSPSGIGKAVSRARRSPRSGRKAG